MIRKLEESDLPRIMQIWLSANKEAHGFIKESGESRAPLRRSLYT